MLILGIDPGLATTGFGLIKVNGSKKEDQANRFNLIDYGCLVTDKEMEEGRRLSKLYRDTRKLLKNYNPDILIIERLFFFRNAKTIISVGQARGVVILAASQSKIPVREYAPLQVKSTITGYGRANKKEVEKEVKKILKKRKLKLKKHEKAKDGHHIDDAVDALAVAITHSYLIDK